MSGVAVDDTSEGINGGNGERAASGGGGEVDYDVAEEDDRWN